MGATRPRIQQWHPSGATDGQVPTYRTATGVYAPETPSPVTVCRGYIVAVGGELAVYLGATPITSSDELFVNGLRKAWGGVDYTLSGSVMLLTTALSAADKVIVTYLTSASCGIPALGPLPTGFTRPVAVTRLPNRLHRVR